VTDAPLEKLQNNGLWHRGNRKVLIIGTIVMLLIVCAGMGTGLGYTLGRKGDSAGIKHYSFGRRRSEADCCLGSSTTSNSPIDPVSTDSPSSPLDADGRSTPSGNGGVVNNNPQEDGRDDLSHPETETQTQTQTGMVIVIETVASGARTTTVVNTALVTATRGSATATTILTSAFRPAAQDAYLNDQLITTRVRTWFYTNKQEAEINQLCAQNNARITQIRVEDGSIPTFSVIMIENTGVYRSDWWWWYGPNSATQGTNRRLTSIDPYYDARGILQFAVVQVPNTGLQNKAWWWYYGVTAMDIARLLTQNNARLVALRGYLYLGNTVYVVIMAENSGVDLMRSEWMLSVTTDSIANQLGRGFRLISLSRNPVRDWDAVFVADSGIIWGWWYGMEYDSAVRTMADNGLRMVDVTPYFLNGRRVFAMVETLNNLYNTFTASN
jgi:hypothetical protein